MPLEALLEALAEDGAGRGSAGAKAELEAARVGVCEDGEEAVSAAVDFVVRETHLLGRDLKGRRGRGGGLVLRLGCLGNVWEASAWWFVNGVLLLGLGS